MSTLDDVKAELLAYEQNDPRSLQVESGASNVYGCRAESLFRLTGQPETDPHLSWQAQVGKAVHKLFESAAGPDVRPEYHVSYRGIPCTVDRWAKNVLTDYKSKDDAAAIAKVQRFGPTHQQIGQVHLGAAAMIEAGYDVERVELLYVPRAGNLDSAYLWDEPFDRKVADEAADWLIAEAARAASLTGVAENQFITVTSLISEEIDADELRDEDPLFCYTYCPFVTACRGEREPQVTDLDDITDAAAQKHIEGKRLKESGEAQMAEVRHYLEGLRGNSAHFRVMTSGGTDKTKTVENLEELRKTYKFVYGDDAPLPLTEETHTTAVTLRVTPRKDAP